MHNGITTQEFLLQAEANLHSDGRLDVGLLDQVMIIMNTEKGEIQAEANRILSKFQEETNAWSSVDTILSADVSLQTKYFALQILETAIKTQWRALPEYQRTGIKEFIVGLITKTCASDHADAQVLLQKYNIVLIQCVKQDWPKNWPNFIPDLLNSSQLNQKSCVNCMRILGLLSEDVFDFGSSSLTQAKEQYLKDNLCGQFGDIFQCCLKFLEECPTHEIVSSCLKTLRRFVTWIPLTYIYDTDFLVLIVDRFLPLDNYRLLALNCLTEIFGNPSAFEGLKRENEKLTQYKSKLRDAYYRIIELLHNFIGDKFDFAIIYAQGSDDDQLFIAGLADFLVAFLKENAEFVEPLTDEYSHLQSKYHDYAINLLLSLSTVNDIEIFKVCLEFWLQLAQELYRDDPFGRPATNSYNYMNGLNDIGVKESPRKLFYRPHLSQLRSIVIGRMAKPEEVLVVENDQGEVVRELVRDTDSIILYKTMRETLVFLTHLDSRDTEEKMTEKLNAQTQGGKFSWKSLNTLCWAIGSISMTMSEEEEKRFLVLVIRDLLGLCEQKRGKDNKAVIASNIMYIVGQYPRFLRQHWKFLKTVVNKLFEFMHESHEGVQDMACDTFIKIAIKCKRQFTMQQLGEKELFIDEMLENQGANTCDLSPPQVQVFYEAMGHVISSCHVHEEQSRMIVKLMQIPNDHWDDMIRRASIETNVIEDPELLRNIANFLKTNSAACRSIGESFSVQLLRNFIDMLSLYKLLSERIAYYVSTGNQDTFKSYIVKLMRSVKKEILVLLSTWSSKNDVSQLLAKELVPKLNSVILLDYQMTVPAARDSKVLSLYSIIISQLQDDATQYLFPILDAVFGCTLEMMQADYESFPEHRVSFFRLILSIVRSCSNFILGLDKDTQKFLLNAVVWGFEHSMRSVAELGLDILKELFENCSRLTSHREMEVAQIFYQNHYMFFLERILIAIADSSNVHVAGLTYYADVMCVIFRTAENDIKVPLAEGISNNMDYISEEVAKFFVANFSQNLTQDQIRVFVKGFFSYNRDVGAMKNHLRDFLIQIKETKGEDTSDLFLEEKEAEITKIQQAKAAIPGMVNPVDLLDEEDMLYTSNNDFLRFSQNELPSRVTVAMLSQDMS